MLITIILIITFVLNCRAYLKKRRSVYIINIIASFILITINEITC